jgi:FtsH-binding integral membrane protein
MAYTQNPWTTANAAATSASVDVGLRAYMLGVYNWMASGLVLTGAVAWAVAETPLRDAFYRTAIGPHGPTLAPTGLALLATFAPLAFVMVISFGIAKLSRTAVQAFFWAFCACMGASLSSIVLGYAHESIAQTFFITAGTFAAMSAWGYTTNRNLVGLGAFMTMGLFGVLLAMIVNIFLQSSALGFATSLIGVAVFVGLTAWDTQRIKLSYLQSARVGGMDEAAKRTVYDALQLYLNFINLFLMLLNLTGNRARN